MEREEVTVRRRVKLYLLNEENEWDDGGTGYVAVVMAPNQADMNLLVNSEADSSALLDTKIDIDVTYQKQQDTLIVWFDNEAQNNLALSFQEAAGCDEIWAKICQVHGKPATVKSTGDEEGDGSPKDGSQGGQHRNSMNRMSSSSALALPPCDLAHLDDLLNAIRDNSRMPNRREKLANAIETGGYIQKLTQIFRMAEDLESTEILVKLYEIIKMLFHLNRSSLLDIMLADAMVMDVVGILEFDPTLKEQAGHRKFLCDRARFHQVLPIKNKELLSKIERTFRLQYIQDIVQPLPLTILDTDTTLSALSSQIYFNKMDIVMSIQNDGPFLDQLFRQLLSSTYCDDLSTTSSNPEEGSDLANNSHHNSVVSTPTGSEKDGPTVAKSQDENKQLECALKNGGGSDDEAMDATKKEAPLNGGTTKSLKNGVENSSNNHLDQGINNNNSNSGTSKVVEHPVPGKAISDEHRLELVLLLRELCNYAHSLQPEQRADFIKRLNDHKICAAIEQLLALDSLDVRQAAIDIFASLVDFSPSMIRDYALHSSSDEVNGQSSDDGLISLVIAELLNDTDPELGSAFHLANLLRLLLDPENMMTTSATRMEKVDFLSLFYKNCMHSLVAPLLAATADLRTPSRDDYKTALQLNLIVELLTFCLEVHGPHIRRYILSRDLIRRILVLVKSRHIMLVLSALRFFRRTIGLKDPTYTEHILSNLLFEPVIEAMLNNVRDNMLRSSFHELFQFIRNETIDEVICHVMDRYGDKLPPNNGRPDPLGTFAWMRERCSAVREQAASTPRHIAVTSPEPPMTSPSPGWTSANSRAQLHYASQGLPSLAGLSTFMRLGMGNGGNNVLLQQQQQQHRLVNNSSRMISGANSPGSGAAATGGTSTGSSGNGVGTGVRSAGPGNNNNVSYLDDDDLGIEDDERWFETDEPSGPNTDTIHQGGEGLADVSAVVAANGATATTAPNNIEAVHQQHSIGDENERNARPHSAPASATLSPQDSTSGSSEAMLDQLHLRMMEARRARADDDALSPTRTTAMTTAGGGLKRSTSALTISINVTTATGKISPAVSPSHSTTSVRTSLVDYESDSDDDNEGSDGEVNEHERRSKKKKGGSGAEDDQASGSQTKRLRSSTSPSSLVVEATAAVPVPAAGDENRIIIINTPTTASTSNSDGDNSTNNDNNSNKIVTTAAETDAETQQKEETPPQTSDSSSPLATS